MAICVYIKIKNTMRIRLSVTGRATNTTTIIKLNVSVAVASWKFVKRFNTEKQLYNLKNKKHFSMESIVKNKWPSFVYSSSGFFVFFCKSNKMLYFKIIQSIQIIYTCTVRINLHKHSTHLFLDFCQVRNFHFDLAPPLIEPNWLASEWENFHR